MRRPHLISLATATTLALACADGPTSITSPEGSRALFQVVQQEPATVVLTPPAATNPHGTSHTVTAHVMDATGQPVEGVLVDFLVGGPVTPPQAGVCRTGPSGRCSFTFTGPSPNNPFPRTDRIDAFADTDEDGERDLGEPEATALKLWTPPTPGCPANGGDDDEDDDGLEDRDENLFSTLIGIADSDGDGIVDGNDDSDGDGTDDEDEDDGTEDDCPNDSDGDGTDDEDEDDDKDDD